MLRRLALLAAIWTIASASPALADPIEALGRLAESLEKFTEFLITRKDQQEQRTVHDAAPNLVKEFVLLSSANEDMAGLLDKFAAQPNDSSIAYAIEDASSRISKSLNRMDRLIRETDPQWSASHPDILKSAEDLRLEKVQILQGAIQSGGIAKLDQHQAATLASRLREEAQKLIAEAKTIGQATTP